jgi:hypothetical protein
MDEHSFNIILSKNKEIDKLQAHIIVLESRLKAIHGAVQLSIDKNLLIDCDCEFCVRLHFIRDESDLTPREPFTGPLPVKAQQFVNDLVDAQRHINDLEDQLRFISVTERLPEPNTKCEVRTVKDNCIIARYAPYDNDNDNDWLSYGGFGYFRDVISWRYIPSLETQQFVDGLPKKEGEHDTH